MSHHPDLLSLLDAARLGDDGTPAAPETLPGRLAAAAAATLGADGASLSLLSLDLRVPLGGSDAEAESAEQLQFTVGEGPCLDVMHHGRPIVCDQEQLREAWPLFARDFLARTSFRSVSSVPLPFTTRGDGGAMDLYHRDARGSLAIDPADAEVVADRIVTLLTGSPAPSALAGSDDATKIPWLDAPGPRRRMEVWVALGIVTVRGGIDTAAALTALRAYAIAHAVDVDTVAADLVTGRLDAGRLVP